MTDVTRPAPPDAAPRTGTGFDRRLIAPMILGSVLNPINSSMLTVALVPIGRAFHVSPAQTAWLVSGLYLATAVGQPVIGRLVDIYGPRLLYLTGTALVGVAGLIGVLAPTLGVLIGSRVLLGIGTCAAYPASMFLLRTESERTGLRSPNGILAALSGANQVIVVIGPTLGGLLIAAGGWPLIFAVNVPMATICLILGSRRLPRRTTTRSDARVDVLGITLFTGMLLALLLFLMAPAPGRWYLPVLAAAIGTCFALRELRTTQPFIDLRILAGNPPLLATYGRQFLAYTTLYAFIYGYGQWLQDGRGLTAPVAGLLFLPMGAAAVSATALTGRRGVVRGKLIVGATVQIAGCVAVQLVHANSPLWYLALLSIVIGIPQGLNGLANQNALYAQAEPARMGSSAGLLRTCMYLGALTAAAANAAFYRHGATTVGLHRLGWLLLGIAGGLTVVSLADRSLRRVGRPG